jgi:hypothetical protein
MTDPTLPLSGLSPVSGKTVITKFDGGLLSSDGGVMALREVEQRLRVARTPGFGYGPHAALAGLPPAIYSSQLPLSRSW